MHQLNASEPFSRNSDENDGSEFVYETGQEQSDKIDLSDNKTEPVTGFGQYNYQEKSEYQDAIEDIALALIAPISSPGK